MGWSTSKRIVIAVWLAAAVSAGTSFSQEPTIRVRGTIEQADRSTLVVKARGGNRLTVHVPESARIVAIVKGSLGDIIQGSFIGTTAVPQQDGSLRAIEVHVFPESMRGTGEGHRAWDLGPTTTMTNGTVAQSVARVDGNLVTVKYRDGEKTVVVTPETSIVVYAPGDRSELEPGAKIFISAAAKQPDGSLQTERVNVGRNGLDPPM
jgi:hypothetical protein